ncbi:iron(III) transport system permease protein [Roseibium hamelinense]|uniref:Iron(III) transport system permease protein n=1 Tax=Roseibium hamelinense TaxID=150831 RepID=A0A562SLT4_9HYPH|nr:iron ABC transporter permease [Roseibium hamelinense]MTI42257.1 iron ABC transporter permease [Roseibium hamelinense]TWI82152.1 iron(III) transport system permease protein [Roseibium hamelinense]
MALSRHLNGEGLTLAILLLAATIVCGLPLFLLFKLGFTSDGALSLGPLLEALNSRSVQRALWHSLESSFLSACAATLLGASVALLISLTDVRAKGLLVFLILLPMMIPPHVTAIAWIQALGPASPVLRWLGIAPEIGSTHPLYSREGLVLLLTLQHSPLVFLLVRAALRSFPRELSDAARVSGAGALRMLVRVTLPLLAPSLLAGFALAFVAALGNFGINALIGIPARYTTLPVLVWRRLASFGPDVLPNVAVISVILAAVALAAISLQSYFQHRMRTTLIGPPQTTLAIPLGRNRTYIELGLWAFVGAVLLLPAASLVATALVKTYGVPLAINTITFENFAEILWRQSVTLRAFVNSTFIAAAASIGIAVISILLGYFLSHRTKSHRRAAGLALGQAEVAFAVPGLVMSIAFILAFIAPLPFLNISLYGTIWIILIAYMSCFLAIGLKPVGAVFLQLDRSLEDAARVAGAGFERRLRIVFAPLVAPAAASGAVLVFLTAYNEVTVSALLWSTGNETIGTTIFNYEDGGYTTLAAAMSTVVVVATVFIMIAMNALRRRVPTGTIPWVN